MSPLQTEGATTSPDEVLEKWSTCCSTRFQQLQENMTATVLNGIFLSAQLISTYTSVILSFNFVHPVQVCMHVLHCMPMKEQSEGDEVEVATSALSLSLPFNCKVL